jgi:hypothetical protein
MKLLKIFYCFIVLWGFGGLIEEFDEIWVLEDLIGLNIDLI